MTNGNTHRISVINGTITTYCILCNSSVTFIVNIAPHGSRINWSDYHRLSVINEFLDCLETSHPSLCSALVIGRSLEKRDIKVFIIVLNYMTNIKYSWIANIWHDFKRLQKRRLFLFVCMLRITTTFIVKRLGTFFSGKEYISDDSI